MNAPPNWTRMPETVPQNDRAGEVREQLCEVAMRILHQLALHWNLDAMGARTADSIRSQAVYPVCCGLPSPHTTASALADVCVDYCKVHYSLHTPACAAKPLTHRLRGSSSADCCI